MFKKVTEKTTFNSAQEVFEYMIAALAKQGEKSETPKSVGSCKYRLGKKRCPAGHLIPDTVYHDFMEGIPWDDLVAFRNFPKFETFLKSSGLYNHTSLIRKIQARLHDSAPDKMFESKEGFIDIVNQFITSYEGLKPIDWSKIKFSKKLTKE